jgi:sec-independent protein translocase protein TatA
MRLGGPEIILILLVVVLIFGVGKLPQIGKSMGEAMRGFKEGSTGETEKKVEATAVAAAPTTELSPQEQQDYKEWQEYKKWQASQTKSEDQA